MSINGLDYYFVARLILKTSFSCSIRLSLLNCVKNLKIIIAITHESNPKNKQL